MRMDRYSDLEDENSKKQTRTNKNQELYTDVYLNNVYVDIDNLKDVVLDNEKEEVVKKVNIEEIKTNYKYEEKEYDIRKIIEETIKNKKDDNIKRSYSAVDDIEIANLIESINENIKQEKIETKESDDLLSDLVTNNESTKVLPLENPISNEVLKEETKKEEKEVLETKKEIEEMGFNELVDEFKETSSKGKIILIILSIILIIGVIVGFLFYKDLI